MNKQKQIEACARIEGWERAFSRQSDSDYCLGDERVNHLKLGYDDDNSLMRIVRGMFYEDYIHSYIRELAYIVGLYKDTNYSLADIAKMNDATPDQIREALIKAHGLWENEEVEG